MSKKGLQLVGQTVRGYKIIKSIGEGKFSYVFRAENEDRVPYALKSIKIFDMADQKQRDKCLKEVELMKPLDHPNIIKYVDSFIENNELYIVAEWAEKGDLKKLIKDHTSDDNQFDEHIIWEYMRQISSALKHMHDKKIMHRDLKPANIFISSDMSLKIGDFGLGRVFGSETLEAYSKVGTPLYMSPELIQDSGYQFNADVWSLGCICYELCQLNSPFRNKQQKMSLMDLFDNITKCNYKPISSRYSPELSQVIKKMIVVDPNNRLSSEQVLSIAEENLGKVKKSLLDPFIVMDDIHIKLNLLNYTEQFCKAAERPPINKFYFAIEEQKSEDQLFYFVQLCYWIMGLSKPQKNKGKLAVYTKSLIDWSSPSAACRKLLVDLSGHGVKIEEVNPESILNGYGEAICFILNEVLNRELIRSNFVFREPAQQPLHSREEADIDEDKEAPEDDIERESVGSESMEEESQFEQSIFFNKNNNKKVGSENQELLAKIQEINGEEEDREMIVCKVDEKEWQLECLRVEKQLHDITTYAKQARQKNGYQNFQIAKLSASKISDFLRNVQPATNRLCAKVQEDLDHIKKGEVRINESFSSIGAEYSARNKQFQEFHNRAQMLNSVNKQKMESLQKVEQKVEEISDKIKLASSENESNKVGEIRKHLDSLRNQLKDMTQREGILMWQLRTMMIRQKKQNDQPMRHPDESEFDFAQ